MGSLKKMLASTPRVVRGTPRCPSKSVRGAVPVRCPRLCATFSKRRNQSSSFLRASSTEIPSVSKSEDGENGRGRGELAGNNQTEAQEQGRIGVVERKTKETSVYVKLNLDGTGQCDAVCGVPFLEHMLDQIASHGLIDLEVKAEGDIWIDDHHTTEDIALALGQCLSQALGTRAGIHRFGDFSAPLDEALINVVLDLSGRPHTSCDLVIPSERIGTFQTEMVPHFFESLANTSGMTLHIRQLNGKNSHHIVEATFKAFARALRQACSYDPRRKGKIASSKGVLTQS